MRLLEKFKIKLVNSKFYKWKFLGFCFLEYEKSNDSHRIKFYSQKHNTSKNKIACYLKVNRLREYTFLCIQHWINIMNEIPNVDFYIVCDNNKLKRLILKNIVFFNSNVNFIKSNVRVTKKLGDKIAIKKWRKAAYAHLTTYYHAHTNKYDSFWNIDADDTIILLSSQKVANIMSNVAAYSSAHGIDNLSLDMWRSYTGGKHWTFGITYTINKTNWLSLIKKLYTKDWFINYKDYNIEYNLDWFFTYLKEYKNVKNETFYIDNCSFIHYGAFLADIIKGSLCEWKDNKISYPIIQKIFKDGELGSLPIASDCIKISANIMPEECVKFLQEYVGKIPCIKTCRKDFEDKQRV